MVCTSLRRWTNGWSGSGAAHIGQRLSAVAVYSVTAMMPAEMASAPSMRSHVASRMVPRHCRHSHEDLPLHDGSTSRRWRVPESVHTSGLSCVARRNNSFNSLLLSWSSFVDGVSSILL